MDVLATGAASAQGLQQLAGGVRDGGQLWALDPHDAICSNSRCCRSQAIMNVAADEEAEQAQISSRGRSSRKWTTCGIAKIIPDPSVSGFKSAIDRVGSPGDPQAQTEFDPDTALCQCGPVVGSRAGSWNTPLGNEQGLAFTGREGVYRTSRSARLHRSVSRRDLINVTHHETVDWMLRG